MEPSETRNPRRTHHHHPAVEIATAESPDLVLMGGRIRLLQSDLKRLDDWRQREGLSRSAAVRLCVRAGIDSVTREAS